MRERITSAVFSLTGISIAIGVIGFVASIATLFIDVDRTVSIKWLILLSLIFLWTCAILLKVIHDLSSESHPPPNSEVPVRFVEEEGIFVIRRNPNFVNSIVVGCYLQDNEIEKLVYIATVYHVQDNVIQIKIHSDLGIITESPSTSRILRRVLIRPVVPVAALQQFESREDADV